MANFLVEDAVDAVYRELNLIGQQIDSTDVNYYLTKAIKYFSTTYAFPTAKRSYDILLFNGVREYDLPTDFGTLIEPQRPPALHSPPFMNSTAREIAHWPYGKNTSIEYDYETPFLTATDDCGFSTLLESCDDDDDATLSGDGSGLSVSNMIYTQGTGSLRFTITASGGTTTLTFSIDAFDLTDWLTKAYTFCDLICPSTNTRDIASVVFRIGNDASNYYQMTATDPFRGDGIAAGINTIGFSLPDATTVGTVDDTDCDFLQIVITNGTTAGVNGVYYLDNIFLSQGVFYQIPYYSLNNIRQDDGSLTDTVDADSLEILLPNQTEEAVTYKTLELAAGSPNIANQSFANFAARELLKKESLLKSLYPHQRSLVRSKWYKKAPIRSGTGSVGIWTW